MNIGGDKMKLNEKIVIEILTVNPNNEDYYDAKLGLPATSMEMEDALQRARIPSAYNDIIDISVLNCPYLPALCDIRADGATLQELNLFASRMTLLSKEELLAMNGIFQHQMKAGKYEDGISIDDLINLTYGLSDIPIVPHVDTDAELGQFVIENDLNEALSMLDDETLELIDRAKVGKKQKELEGGEYVKGGYVATGTYMFPQEYKRAAREQLKMNNSIVFALDIARAPKDDEEELSETAETIYLPLPKEEANRIAMLHGEKCIEECVYYDFKSAIHGIDAQMFGDVQNFDKLNDIAERYAAYSTADRVKFKAVMDKEAPETIDDVIDIADNLHRYELSYYSDHPDVFAREYLAHHLSADFDMDYLGTIDDYQIQRLGQKLLKRLGAEQTDYGVISARDKGLFDLVPCREERIIQTEEMGEMTL